MITKLFVSIAIIAISVIGLSLSYSLIEIRDVNMGIDPNNPETGARRYGIVGLCWLIICITLILAVITF